MSGTGQPGDDDAGHRTGGRASHGPDHGAGHGAAPGASRGPVPVLDAGDPRSLAAAEAALADGSVVAVPTDTVYGLAARVDRPEGLAAVFRAKRRPADLTLPVLVDSVEQARGLSPGWPSAAQALAARLWPGPLTLVVPAVPGLGPRLGGVDTVGVRLPDHPTVRALCLEAGPLAVTSANLHGRPPATTAAQVAATFSTDDVALVLDGGDCAGTPSTVVDVTAAPPACLRTGGVPWSTVLEILEALGGSPPA